MKTSEVAATFHIHFTPAIDAGRWSVFQQGQSPKMYLTDGLAGPTTIMGRLRREVSLPQPELNPPALSISHVKKFMALNLD